jgi:DNA-directed RNA polymerase subunit RPC12/RpoP
MAEKQKLKCSECGEEFEFDPNSDEQVITSFK